MHLKAIEIKERLLGPDDYEVALSIGHFYVVKILNLIFFYFVFL
jgi:hypothetical protein